MRGLEELAKPLLTAAQMRAADRWAIETLGVPGAVLMETAGRGVAAAISRRRPVKGVRVAVVCGRGQNGGDGYVIARYLALAGAVVEVFTTAPLSALRGDAALFAAVVSRLPGVGVRDFSDTADAQNWAEALRSADILVDAVFGTGLRSEVTGVERAAIDALNAAPGWRVAVDVPSGVEADTGRVLGAAVHANLTVTIGAHKLGLALDADAPTGRQLLVPLGVPLHRPASGGPYALGVTAALVREVLPRLTRAAHKGTRGHLLVVAGSAGKTGAAVLAATAGLRAGAGLVTIAAPASACAAMDSKVLEVMTASYSGAEDAEANSFETLSELARPMRAVALGPGMPRGPHAQNLVRRLAAELPVPMVVDADGLNHLATSAADVLPHAASGRVLTPHPGEAARLLGTDTAAVQSDRAAAARALARQTGAVVVLKGARTLVATADGTLWVNPTADASLATAGSGDVLTGVIGGLLSQGLAPREAAIAGVFVHGRAARDARKRLGTRTLVAGDLPLSVARVLGRMTRRHR